MRRSWKLGRLFGIPVFVHPTFLLLVVFAAFTGPRGPLGAIFSVVVLVTIFSCIVLHELGHALMARYFGIPTRDITLYPIGGVARLERLNDSPRQEFCIALAGPAVNLILVLLLAPVFFGLALAGGLARFSPELTLDNGWLALATQFVFVIGASNGVLMVFNLAPAFPMDGGRVFRALLTPFFGTFRATLVAVWLGFFLAGAVAALAIFKGFPMLVLVALFVVLAGQQELLMARRRALLEAEAAPEQQPEFTLEREPNPVPPLPFFTGVTWDGKQRLWVRWHNGRPVAAYAGRKA